jgi:hypothetical protein
MYELIAQWVYKYMKSFALRASGPSYKNPSLQEVEESVVNMAFSYAERFAKAYGQWDLLNDDDNAKILESVLDRELDKDFDVDDEHEGLEDDEDDEDDEDFDLGRPKKPKLGEQRYRDEL